MRLAHLTNFIMLTSVFVIYAVFWPGCFASSRLLWILDFVWPSQQSTLQKKNKMVATA